MLIHKFVIDFQLVLCVVVVVVVLTQFVEYIII